MAQIKENDFVELDYTGRISDGGEVFDTTFAETAKKAGVFDEHTAYWPAVVCIGKKHLIAGLDKQLVGKEVGSSYHFKIPSEDAFGRKDAKLIQLISTSKFRQQNMTPFPGLQVNVDGILGTVRAVTGGRTIVDFNHPLSGRDVEYDVTVKRIINDSTEKVKAVLRLIGISAEAVKASYAEGVVSIEFPEEAPEQLKKDVEEKLKSSMPEIKSVSMSVKPKTPAPASVEKNP